MNNLECAVAVLVLHREARQWSDMVVAVDLLTQLGLIPDGTATHARPPVNDPSVVTEDEVLKAETVAREAADKASAARNALNAQKQQEAEAAGWAAMHAKAEAEAMAAAAAVAEAQIAAEAAEANAPRTPAGSE